jgi:hypothetical protein
MTISWGDVPAYAALGLSVVALGVTLRFNTRQSKFFENQQLLNKQMLRQIDEQAKEKKQADFGARIAKLGKSDYRLKVFNAGKAPGRNVRIEVLEGKEMLLSDDLEDKFPADRIDPGNGIELMVSMYLDGPTKLKLRILWEDDQSMSQEKVVTAHA